MAQRANVLCGIPVKEVSSARAKCGHGRAAVIDVSRV
jgi:hypothetical protein